MPIFWKLQALSKRVSLKIWSKGPQKLGPFFSLFLMRKTLSSGQKWFLRPFFPLIRSTFLLRSLRFSFRALEVPRPRVRKRPFYLLKWPFPHYRFGHFRDWAEYLRPLLKRNIPLLSGKYGLWNHFWPLESGFSHEQKWEKGAWSNETPPTPFFRSTGSQNSCQIEFSSRNGREISDSVFWNN